MTKLEQAARQARIALQKCAHALGSYSHSDFRQRMGGIKEAESAMQSLDAVLAEQAEQEPVIRATLAPPAPPEVYQMRSRDAYEAGWWEAQRQKAVSPIAPAQQAEQEPVAWYAEDNLEERDEIEVIWTRSKPQYAEVWKPLYAAPVQQVDLTDDEIVVLIKQFRFVGMTDRNMDFARAVIAAYKEKNKCFT